jgi:hypothetical protein
MNTEIDRIVAFVRDVLDRNFDLVPTPSGKGAREHAEVWTSKTGKLPLAFEDKLKTMVNLWFLTKDVPIHLPKRVDRFDRVWDIRQGKWIGDEEGEGANHNLIHYPRQFGHEPITRLRLRTVADTTTVLDQVTKGAATRTANRATFLLKIDGSKDAPNQICRPTDSSEWEDGLITMKWNTPRASSYSDKRPGPMPKKGDLVYIWAHEHKDYGHGKGLTATAIVADDPDGEEEVRIKLQDVELLPRPFGFVELENMGQTTPLLREIHAARGARAWCILPNERKELNALIETYGSAKAAEIVDATNRHLSDLDRALTEGREDIKAAEEDRKTAVVKARPNQANFRANAMKRHNARCVVTRFRVTSVLEAAHVIPHTGNPAFEVPENSLILRRDIHALFDACLLAIHPKSNQILISPELTGTPYEKLAGRTVDHQLAPEALRYQHRRFQKTLPTDIAA